MHLICGEENGDMYNFNHSFLEEIISEVDMDRDGRISIHEFTELMIKNNE
jgi:Ca2+-binding EF-hand superfamily protein